jgi:hypothetical protein
MVLTIKRQKEKPTFAEATVNAVASTGIEPVYQVPETCVLSIVLRGQSLVYLRAIPVRLASAGRALYYEAGQQNYRKKFWRMFMCQAEVLLALV